MEGAIAHETAVSAGGGAFLVAWSRAPIDAGRAYDVRGRFYVPDGGLLGPEEGFVIASGADAKSLSGAAFAGSSHLVVWTENGVLYGSFVRSAEEIGPAMVLAEDVVTAAVAAKPSGFLVAPTVGNGEGSVGDVRGILVPPDNG